MSECIFTHTVHFTHTHVLLGDQGPPGGKGIHTNITQSCQIHKYVRLTKTCIILQQYHIILQYNKCITMILQIYYNIINVLELYPKDPNVTHYHSSVTYHKCITIMLHHNRITNISQYHRNVLQSYHMSLINATVPHLLQYHNYITNKS